MYSVASWPLVRNRPEPLEQESGHTIDVADLKKKKKRVQRFRYSLRHFAIIYHRTADCHGRYSISKCAEHLFQANRSTHTCIGFRIFVVHGDVSSHEPFVTSQDESYITLMGEKHIVYRPVTEVRRWHDRSPQRVPLTRIIFPRVDQCARIVRVMVDGTL